jgi:hypothetical protein
MNIENENTAKELDVIEVVDQQQINDCGYGCPFFKNIWIAQGFTPTLDSLTKIELKLFRTGNPTNTLTVSIRSMLTGSDLSFITLEGVTIPPYGTWVEFDIPDISINSGEMYYIIIRTPGGSFLDYYCCLFDINNPYSEGETWGSLNSGGTWSLIEDPDFPNPDGCFKTYGFDEPPNIPEIDGASSGSPGIEYSYTISASDLDGHDVFYFVDWGDDSNTGWCGPFNSGKEEIFKHLWEKKGTYLIKAKSKDVYGAESDWSFLEVTMPMRRIHNSFIDNIISFLTRFFGIFYSY